MSEIKMEVILLLKTYFSGLSIKLGILGRMWTVWAFLGALLPPDCSLASVWALQLLDPHN